MTFCRHRRSSFIAAIVAPILAALSVPAAEPPASAPASRPRRIVSLVPHATEILFAIGAGEKVVGVGDSSLWPDEARERPRVGGLMDPRIDEILALKPDLVILTPSHVLHVRPLKTAGIETLTLSTNSVKEALFAIHDLSVATGCEERARQIVGPMVEELNSLGAEAKKRKPVRVLLCVYHDDSMEELLALAPGNYLHEILGIAGGENVIALRKGEVGISYRITPAEVREAKPEVVIDLLASPPSAADKARIEADWRGMFGAVDQPRRIHVIHDPYLPTPGIRIPESIRKIRGMMLPPGP